MRFHCVALSVVVASSAYAGVADIEKELGELTTLRQQYEIPILKRDYASRLAQGKASFDARAYRMAMSELGSLDDSTETLQLLAESAFQLGLNELASDYFREALKRPHADRLKILERLIEIDDRLANYDELTSDFKAYIADTTQLPPRVRYLYGKSQFLLGSEELDLPGDDARSRYILAALDVKRGDFEAARQKFTQLVKRRVQSIDDRSVKDLSILGVARINSRKARYRDAVLWYQKLPLDSSYLSQMRIELAMSYISYGDQLLKANWQGAKRAYVGALHSLYRLVRADKSAANTLQVKVIYADLLERLERGERALELYANVRRESEQLLAQAREPSSVTTMQQDMVKLSQYRVEVLAQYADLVSNLPREVQAYEQQFTDVLTRLDAIKHDLSELKEPHDDLMAKTTELHHAFWDIRARAASDVQSILSRQMKHLQTISGKIVQLESSARHEREKAIEIATRDTRRHVKEWLSRADLGQLNMKLTKKRSVDRRILALEKKQSQELAALDVAFAGAP